MTLLGYAAQAASRGFHIFPCNPAGTENPEKPGELIEKWPHLIRPGQPYKIKWGDVATNDLNKVTQWWTYSPQANIGVACKPSGLLVVDCDVAKKANAIRDTPYGYLHDKLGPWVDGEDCLRELCERFGDGYDAFAQTYRVCTASGGLHLYFRWPEGVQASQASPVPGALDIRCNGGSKGGYVLAAGSITAKGSYIAENNLPIADAPPWFVELCREKPKPRPMKDAALFSQPGHSNFSGLVESVRLAQEGNRNNCLLWAARSMCQDGATEEECIDLLVPAAMECGLDGGERQALATIRSAYRLQGSKL